MPLYRYAGPYPANVTLPDGTVRLTDPGEAVELDTDQPGPAWQPATPDPDAVEATPSRPPKSRTRTTDTLPSKEAAK